MPFDMRAYMRRRYHALKQRGLCVHCGQPPVAGRVLCSRCNDRARAAQKKNPEAARRSTIAYQGRHAAKGLCHICPRPVEPGSRYCPMHREQTNKSRRKRQT